MTRSFSRSGLVACLALLGLALPGCSIRSMAINKVGDALADSGPNYASDDDPELVGQAVPFGLKTMEGLLQSAPRHKGLLLAASSGFVQYAYGWVQLEGDMVEAKDLDRATELRGRARRLYLRARDYGLRGLEVDFPGLRDALRRDPKAALAPARKEHVPLLYWSAMGWAGAMALKVNDSDVSADQPIVEALARRALELDPCWGLGSIHEFFVSWEAGRSSIGGSVERAREHFEKDLACAQGRRAFPYLTYAESVCVSKQDKAQFKELLEKALAIDTSRADDQRLANLLAQKRARWQLGRVDELFIE
ncbi:MAG TPA: TRAP transporter TatT component family protein [Vicinamibacteria bacterium]|nr:TRAP transporter TatT component family protein [Vicinamibacteria bacterium]